MQKIQQGAMRILRAIITPRSAVFLAPCLALALIFAFTPFHIAQAGIASSIVDAILGTFLNAADNIFGYLLTPVVLIVEALFIGITSIFTVALDIILTLTVLPGKNPTTPEFVTDAWDVTRNIANLFFILIFAFIGLATILRIPNYETQKLLPSLLIVALLVNFSGVFVGFIVDIGNILTTIFLHETTKIGGDWNFFTAAGGHSAVQQIIRIIFYLLATLIYFVVLILFAVRILFLWTLTILAPLAFVARILPQTKKYWDQWLQQLVQWSIVAVPVTFFMYLAKKVLEASSNYGFSLNDVTEPLGSFVAPITALFLLAIGVMASMQMAPAGAKGAIDFGKKWGLRGGLAAGSGAWRRFGTPVENFSAKMRQRGQDIAAKAGQDMRNVNKDKNILQRSGAAVKWAVAGKTIGGLGRGMEMLGREGTMRMRQRDEKELKAAQEEGKKNPGDAINQLEQEFAKGPAANMNRITGIVTGLIGNGNKDDINKALNDGRLTRNQMRRTYKHAKQSGTPYRRMMEKGFMEESMGDTAETNLLGVAAEDRKRTLEVIAGEDISKEIVDLTKFDPSNNENQAKLLDELMKNRGAELLPAIAKMDQKDARDRILKYIAGDGTAEDPKIRALAKNSPAALKWLTSGPGARILGTGIDMSPAQADQLIREAQTEGKTTQELETRRTQIAQATREVDDDPSLATENQKNAKKNQLAKEGELIDQELETRRFRNMSPEALTELQRISPRERERLQTLSLEDLEAERSIYTKKDIAGLEAKKRDLEKKMADQIQQAAQEITGGEFARERERIQTTFQPQIAKLDGELDRAERIRRSPAIRKVQAERAAAAKAPAPLDQQPAIVQIAALEKEREQLQQDAKVPFAPGDAARKRVKEINAEISLLESQKQEQTPTQEDDVLKLQSDLYRTEGGRNPATRVASLVPGTKRHREAQEIKQRIAQATESFDMRTYRKAATYTDDRLAEELLQSSQTSDTHSANLENIRAQIQNEPPNSPLRTALRQKEQEVADELRDIQENQRELLGARLFRTQQKLDEAQGIGKTIEEEIRELQKEKTTLAPNQRNEAQAIDRDIQIKRTELKQRSTEAESIVKQQKEDLEIIDTLKIAMDPSARATAETAAKTARAREAAAKARTNLNRLITSNAHPNIVKKAEAEAKKARVTQEEQERLLLVVAAKEELEQKIAQEKRDENPVMLEDYDNQLKAIEQGEALMQRDKRYLNRAAAARLEKDQQNYIRTVLMPHKTKELQERMDNEIKRQAELAKVQERKKAKNKNAPPDQTPPSGPPPSTPPPRPSSGPSSSTPPPPQRPRAPRGGGASQAPPPSSGGARFAGGAQGMQDFGTRPSAPTPPSTPQNSRFAGTSTPGGMQDSENEPQIGDLAHWVGNGVQRTHQPIKITRIEMGPDGKKYAFIEHQDPRDATSSAIPLNELIKEANPRA
ncbi:MAG: hypothetical protein HY482_00970 [Candidatus Wildermuthbacteria bacterium]|nr:hypothetical protein [Candidatus Wildermuthbacteria bacterium]